MPWLLNTIYALLLIAALPVMLYQRVLRGKRRDGWREKLLGCVPVLDPVDERVWLHAVSVGEVLLLRGVIAELRTRRPDADFILSTTTTTGHEVARGQYPDLTVFYCPLDFSWAVRRAIRHIKPTALVLAELELWPNLILAASEAGVGLAIVNGRLGEKSFRGYRRLRPLVKRLLARFQCIAVQNDEYQERFCSLGAPANRAVVTGSVKFDLVQPDRTHPRTVELRDAFGLTDDELVFIAGSTQHPEEEYALETWRELQCEFPTLRLILVPRHKERFDEVARLVERHGLPLIRRSRHGATPNSTLPTPSSAVCLLDTLGELGACWGLADVAFVGGSLTNRGGQNMIEPAACGAAVLFGPNTWNFRDAVQLLLSHDAAIVVRSRDELTTAVRGLLSDPAQRQAFGERSRAAVAAHRGATAKSVDLLERRLMAPRPGVASQRAA